MDIKMTQRDGFFDTLCQRAQKDPNIIVITADMGAIYLDKFKEIVPNQFINAGVSEQNAILIGAGLAKEGKKVFIYSIAPFITLRCLEQIRVSCGIMNIPLNIIGLGTGFGYCNDGPTHHLIEDFGIMRSIPRIKIWNLTDIVIARYCAAMICDEEQDGSNYIRMDKDYFPQIYGDKLFISDECGFTHEYDTDYLILTSGIMAHVGTEIVRKLEKTNTNIGLIDFYKLPLDYNHIKFLKLVSKIFTLEEHFLNAGFGSYILEVLNVNNLFIPVKRIGISNQCGYAGSFMYGGRKHIHKYYKIDKNNILKQILENL